MSIQRLGMPWFVLALAAGACTSAPAVPQPVSTPAGAAVPATEPLGVRLSDFQHLRWIEGRWRGEEPNGKPFFEGYRFENDSTIRSYSYADSVNSVPSDSGVIVLRKGEVSTGSEGARWVASELTARHVAFVPQRGVRNSFVWERTSADTWTATLRWPAAADRSAREVVYRMRRLSS